MSDGEASMIWHKGDYRNPLDLGVKQDLSDGPNLLDILYKTLTLNVMALLPFCS